MGPAHRVLAVLASAGLAACGSANVKPPQAPDDSVLSDAEAMVAKAGDAGAAEFAPDALMEARRRLTTARSLLYRDADDDAIGERVQRLADAAYLDGRLALNRTQAGAVQRKLQELTAELDRPQADDDAEATP